MKFALFFLGEYVNALAVSFVFSTLFLGGYAGPILPPYVWILLKAALVFFVFMWLRGTLPRVRIDQMHALNWKFLVPMSTVNLVLVMLVLKLFPTSESAAQAFGGLLVTPWVQTIILAAVNLGVLFTALTLAARAARRFRQAEEEMIMRRRAANLAAAKA